MKRYPQRILALMAIGALCFAWTAVATAQAGSTTSSETRDFEIIAVDGKPMSVRDLHAGMKGTATVTTTVTTRPVVVTEVREAEVLRASDQSVTVREGDAVRRFTQGQLDEKGVQIVKDGKPIRVGDLHRGDHLTATIVTQGTPVVLTKQEVDATLAEPQATAVAAALPPATADVKPAAQPASPAPAPAPAAAPADASDFSATTWIVIVLLAALVIYWLMRRRDRA